LSFSKMIVAFLLANGVIWIYASYLLAYMGRVQIAETLSRTVVVEVLGVIAIYAAKALLENLSKHNIWPDKPKTVIGDPVPAVEIAPEPLDDEPCEKTKM